MGDKWALIGHHIHAERLWMSHAGTDMSSNLFSIPLAKWQAQGPAEMEELVKLPPKKCVHCPGLHMLKTLMETDLPWGAQVH